MSNRFFNPAPQFASATDVYSGGFLYFYITGTSTPTNTYSNSTLVTPNANPITLDSAGRSPTDIFLDPNTTYKVVLKDSAGVTIWTKDPVVDPAANVSAAFAVYPGNPNGNVAGNEGSLGGSGASAVYDITNDLLYVCTTTGTATTAVWTQVAAAISGALSLTSIISPTSLAADQNNYSPTGFSTAFHVRQDSSVSVQITGWAGGGAGRVFDYTNISAFRQYFMDEHASSTAANRFSIPGGYYLVIEPKTSKLFWYDSISSRWRPVGDHYNTPTGDPGGRLTLTTAIPVLTSDVTAATTIFYTGYKHSYIRLYTGSSWITFIFSELSQTLADNTKSPAAGAVSSVYDMFVWNDAGTLRCTRGPAWATAVTRGTGAGTTELVRVDGTWLNNVAITNGPAAQRGTYVGTIATSASGANGQLNMMFFPAAAAGGSGNRLDVWNMYNRVAVASTCRDSTNTWAYTTATWRAANNNTANRITVVCGLNEDAVSAVFSSQVFNGTSNSVMRNGIGLDSTTAWVGMPGVATGDGASTVIGAAVAIYSGLTGLGSHYYQEIEYATAVGSAVWHGDNNEPLNSQSGLQLTWWM